MHSASYLEPHFADNADLDAHDAADDEQHTFTDFLLILALPDYIAGKGKSGYQQGISEKMVSFVCFMLLATFYAQNRKAQIICGCVNGVLDAIFMGWINHQTWHAWYLPALLLSACSAAA